MASHPNPKIALANEGLVRKDEDGKHHWTGTVRVTPELMHKPETWKRPRLIFPVSLGDVFHDQVEDKTIIEALQVMGRCPQHRFLILTKRVGRMHDLFRRLGRTRFFPENWKGDPPLDSNAKYFPNCWLGCTVEDQSAAEERLYWLAMTPAAQRFISLEPLLGPVNLGRWLSASTINPYFHWFIVGGESGPDARPCELDWVRGTRDQVKAVHGQFHLKQLRVDGKLTHLPELDGQVWDEFPEDDFFKGSEA